jgi:predicted transcriptional regulator
MFRKMIEDERRRAGWSVGRAAWELGVSIREHQELEAGTRWPSWETFDRICQLFGWPQTYAGRQ